MTMTSLESGHVALVRSLLGLTLITGMIDAVSFLGLGHIFTANMTGNIVFVGFALAGSHLVSPRRSLAALVAFAAGGLAGGRLANSPTRSPIRTLRLGVGIEALLLAVAAVSPGGAYAAIMLTALAMGLRNACVRKIGVADLTTTVLTLTVTGLAADSRVAGGAGPRRDRRIASILAMGAGAWLGGALEQQYGTGVPLMVAAGLGFAVLCTLPLPTTAAPDAVVTA
jgi:uncharacterized membrane protein YoaK (UPF0700 family)